MSQPRESHPSELSKTLADVAIVAVVVVLAIVLIVAFSMFMVFRFLRAATDGGGRGPPAVECAAWLEARRRARSRARGGTQSYGLRPPPAR